jgi:hypothetical protein
VGTIESDGIENAWRTNARTTRASTRPTAKTAMVSAQLRIRWAVVGLDWSICFSVTFGSSVPRVGRPETDPGASADPAAADGLDG